MKMTIRSQYGLVILLDIAFHQDVGPVQRRQIAQRQGIPTDWLDQVLMRLREGGLVQSVRGRVGGYFLKRQPEEVSVWDVVRAVENGDVGTVTAGSAAEPAKALLADPAWHFVHAALVRQLKKLTLDTLLKEGEGRLVKNGFDPILVMESRTG